MSTFPIISDDPAIQSHYLLCRAQGTSHSLAEMLAFAQPPQGVSDCTFMRGTANGRQFQGQEQTAEFYRKVTESEGGSVKGKKYLSSLARYPGDPLAWVEGRGDVVRRCEAMGRGCEGAVTVKARETTVEPRKPYVSDRLLDREVEEVCAQVPDGHMVDRVDLKEQVRQRRSPKRR